MAMAGWQRAIKRAIDIVGASTALAIAAPIMAVTAVGVARQLGRPVLFRQRRPGQRGVPFTLVKFRTMRDAIDARGQPLPDRDRLTAFGQRLRATSIDELPQLWNVLRGDMSLVGPRPLLMEYLPRYSSEQARRHDVKPGITGWTQVNGRNALSWDDKFALDVWYVDRQSLMLDVRILIATVRAVVRRDGISHGADATMPAFPGAAVAG